MDNLNNQKITKSINKIGEVMHDMQKEKKFKGAKVNYDISTVKLDAYYSESYNILNFITVSNLNDSDIAIELYDRISKTLKGIDFIVRYNEFEELPFKIIDRKRRQTREIREESLNKEFDKSVINLQLNNKGKLILFRITDTYLIQEEFEELEKQLKKEISTNCKCVEIRNIELYNNRDKINEGECLVRAKNWLELEEFFNIMKLKNTDHDLELVVEINCEGDAIIFTNFEYIYEDIVMDDDSNIIEGSEFIKSYNNMNKEFKL